jgi:hypothetical protein
MPYWARYVFRTEQDPHGEEDATIVDRYWSRLAGVAFPTMRRKTPHPQRTPSMSEASPEASPSPSQTTIYFFLQGLRTLRIGISKGALA